MSELNKDKHDDGYITVRGFGHCCVCGKLTNRVEYNYEDFICSQECENVLNKKLMECFQTAVEEVLEI